MAGNTYTVVRGDTLSEIAERYYKNYEYSSWQNYMNYLVELNDISNKDFIVVGQILQLSGTAKKKTNTTSKAEIKSFGLLSNGTSLYASWKWDKADTDHYIALWEYKDANFKDWISGDKANVTDKQSIFSIASGATQVRFRVRPISTTSEQNGKTVSKWTASWSTEKIFYYTAPPEVPSDLNVTIDRYRLKATVSNVDPDANQVSFEVVQNGTKVFAKTTVKVSTRSATYNVDVQAGGVYKVRCRASKDSQHSDWSNYSSDVYAAPTAPSGITDIRAESEDSIYLAWASVGNDATYDIEYTTDKKYFDASSNTTVVNDIDTTHYLVTGLQTGEEYFFRVRAVRENQESNWCAIKSVVLGKNPIAPTTWSSTTTAIVGEDVTLFWVHNSEDGSNERYAEIELIVDGVTIPTQTVENPNLNEEEAGEEAKIRSYILDTNAYTEGTTILWRIRTAGITLTYGDWSTQRTINVYAQPTLDLSVLDSDKSVIAVGDSAGVLSGFPFYIHGVPGPATQAPIGYSLVIEANQSYETTDRVGNDITVRAGSQVYSKYFDISNDVLDLILSAGDIDLENNIEYTVKCTVAMNSGLSVEKILTFQVAWEDLEYEPNAEIGIDTDSVSATIRPYCADAEGNLIENVTLAVYRREFDGGFTLIYDNLDNAEGIFVTDPHPALDYARYRIVAIANATGAVSYCDIAPIPVGEKAAIIQWDEAWSTFEGDIEDPLANPNWAGSLLRLPYNIDISDGNKADVVFVEYIGRSHPVSYYGTQRGHTSTWNADIEKGDEETLYALRRLQNWMGDVYVREPSGSGYWANVVVSFNQKHKERVVPVTLSITRVEGGA